MPCGLQVALSDVKRQPSCLHWAHVDLTYMGGLFAANPALGHRSSWSRFSIGMGLSYCSRLAFWFTLLTLLPIQTGTARVSSSLSTTHHVHHFHNKHGTVPIAINRMPFLTRGGHGKTFPSNSLNLQVCCLANALFRCGWVDSGVLEVDGKVWLFPCIGGTTGGSRVTYMQQGNGSLAIYGFAASFCAPLNPLYLPISVSSGCPFPTLLL